MSVGNRGKVISNISPALNTTEAAELIVIKIALNETIILDIFGGKVSQISNAINVDIIAESGIKASVNDLPQIFPPHSVDEIIASSPQAPFLEQAAQILKPGGRIYINATKGNKFGKVPDPETRVKLGSDALEQLGLRLVQDRGELDPRFAQQSFFRTDGIPIPSSSVKTTILEKAQ
jgi:hypothetical protein